jgi:hypothetical protein
MLFKINAPTALGHVGCRNIEHIRELPRLDLAGERLSEQVILCTAPDEPSS